MGLGLYHCTITLFEVEVGNHGMIMLCGTSIVEKHILLNIAIITFMITRFKAAMQLSLIFTNCKLT